MTPRLKPVLRRAGLLLPFIGALAGCSLAPTYTAPQMVLPASYQGSGPFALAHPEDQLAHGPWWQLFDDPEL